MIIGILLMRDDEERVWYRIDCVTLRTKFKIGKGLDVNMPNII